MNNNLPKIFTGLSFHLLDNKNRLFIPPRYRNGKKYVLTSSLDDCLVIYSFSAWKKVVKKIESLSIKNKFYQRSFTRLFFAEAEIIKLDSQGRILIPKKFKDKYRLEKNIVLIGNKDKIEIWSKDLWLKYYKKISKIIKKINYQVDI